MSRKNIRNNEKHISPFWKWIQELCRVEGITEKEFRERLGLSNSYMSELKSGRAKGTGGKLWRALRREFPAWADAFRDFEQTASDTPSPPPESTKSTRPILTGTVHRERRSPWHPDPRKNELLRMAAFILEVDDPEITPAFEQEIIKAHNALVRGRHPEPEPKKAINQN